MNQKWAAFFRIAIGLFFLAQGLNKLEWYSSSEFLRTSLDRYAQSPPALTSFYQKHVAYPGIEAWSRMIPTGEMLIGVALIVGLLTQPTLIIAVLLVLNFHLANGNLFSSQFLSNPYALVLLSSLVVLFFSKSGSAFAIDAATRKKGSKKRTQ
jgi:thiosulfate dehydrogenase [quinone] large subunit